MSPAAGPVVTVVLAAGAGTRFEGPGHKLTADAGGGGVLELAVGHAVAGAIGPVVVVVPRPGAFVLPDGVTEVVNPRWAEGQATSLRAAVDHAASLDAAAVVIGLGDQPGIEPSAWRAVAAIDAPIVVATYDGAPGHPIRLRADVWGRLPRTGDQGARALVRGHPELVTALPCNGSPFDIDTQEDLRRWQSSSSTSSP